MTDIQHLPSTIPFDALSLQSQLACHGVTMVGFHAEWCDPCRALQPTIDAMAQRFAGRATIGTVDIDASLDLMEAHEVTSIPTLVVFKDGIAVDRLVGLRAAGAIAETLERWL